MPASSAGCEAAVFEIVLGFVVVLGLAIYLVVTLVAPERF